ncbi:hypothetical protein D3C84_807860 [compost metagenome]
MPAKALCQSTCLLNVIPPSRASLAPTGLAINPKSEVSTDENPRHPLPASNPRRVQLFAVLPRARTAVHPGKSQTRIPRRHPHHGRWPQAARLVAAGEKRRRSQRHGAAPARQRRQSADASGRQLVVAGGRLSSAADRLSRLRFVRRRTEFAGDLSGHRRGVQVARPGAGGQRQTVDPARAKSGRLNGRALPGSASRTPETTQGLRPRWRARQLS